MAASITPVKCLYFSSDIQACVLCAKKLTKRLHCLAKFKSTKQNYVKIIEQFTGLVLDPSLLYIKCMYAKRVWVSVKVSWTLSEGMLTVSKTSKMYTSDSNSYPKLHRRH